MKYKDHPIFKTVSEYLKPWENPTTIKSLLRTTSEKCKKLAKDDDYDERDDSRIRQLKWLRELCDTQNS